MNGASPWKTRDRRFGPRLAGVLCVLGSLVACGGVPRTNYYALRFTPAAPAGGARTHLVLGVERFRALDVLQDDRIIYYESPTQLNFYEYHRWSSDPATLLSELSARSLREMQLFADVCLSPCRGPVDYVLKGLVLNFEEVDEGSAARARVGLGLTLVRTRGHKLVWSTERLVERPVQIKGVGGVVEALNAAAQELLQEALPELAAQVERDSSQSEPSP